MTIIEKSQQEQVIAKNGSLDWIEHSYFVEELEIRYEQYTNGTQEEEFVVDIKDLVSECFCDAAKYDWTGEGTDYWFSAGFSGLKGIERLEDDTLLVLEQNHAARQEFIRKFEEIYLDKNPYEYRRWGKAFNWDHQDISGEVGELYVDDWAMQYVIPALKHIASAVVAGTYVPRRS